jgi:hypothetical protein
MALNVELSPVRDFVENLAGEATLVEWLWQAGVLALAVALGWYAARVICREVSQPPHL